MSHALIDACDQRSRSRDVGVLDALLDGAAGQRERALIVLSVAQGIGVSGTARVLGVSRPTVIKWRERFTADGIDGLADLARSGRPKTIDDAQIIAATLDPPPAVAGGNALVHANARPSPRDL